MEFGVYVIEFFKLIILLQDFQSVMYQVGKKKQRNLKNDSLKINKKYYSK